MPDVSVVVPVYNPGEAIDDLLASLDAQTHPRDRWEVIFVDDGSTDGTGARLEDFSAERPWARVEHIPNSGWPGRPRNVGTDLARGEFVLYVDNDDWLDHEAIARLYDRATRDAADIVVGKVVGHGKNVPLELFRQNRAAVDLSWPPLLRLLSPHKLFRRALLEGIRFPEGPVRLEDHSFVLAAFFAAGRISILADHPIYHWMRRAEGNESYGRMDAATYFGRDVPRVLDTVDQHVPAGAARDALYAHWWRSKALWRLQGGAFARRDADHNDEIYTAVRELMHARFPERIDALLPFSLRVLAALVRADRPAGVRALAAYEAGMFARLRLNRRFYNEEGAEMFRFGGRFGGTHVRLRRDGDRLLWVPPTELEPHLDGIGLDVTDEPAVDPQVSVRSTAGVTYPLPVRGGVRLDPVADTDLLQPVVRANARLQRDRAAAGAPLGAGEWSVSVALRYAGFSVSSARARVADVEGTLGEREPVTATV